jgi:hypothetical protein
MAYHNAKPMVRRVGTTGGDVEMTATLQRYREFIASKGTAASLFDLEVA